MTEVLGELYREITRSVGGVRIYDAGALTQQLGYQRVDGHRLPTQALDFGKPPSKRSCVVRLKA